LAGALALPVACAQPPKRLVDTFASAQAAGVPDHDAPYLAVYRRGGRLLAFVAARHEVGVTSPTHTAVRKALDIYAPRAVIAEGFPTALGPSPDSILRAAQDGSSWGLGESGYAVRLAHASGAPFWGGEPTDREVNEALLAEGWSADDVLGDEVLRMLPQTLRAGEISGAADPRLDRLIVAWSERVREGLNGAAPMDRAQLEAWYASMFGVAFETDSLFSDRHRPDRSGRFSRLVERQGVLRNNHLFGVIRDRLATDRTVLVVYGASHLFTLWRALEADLGAAEIA
jgi:hypothetical protein